MFSVDLTTRQYDGHVVVALCGELDLVDAGSVAAALAEAAVGVPEIIVDLAALEFIDSSGVAALAYGRRQARRAGSDLMLAAPQQQVRKILAITRQADPFCIHASVAEAAGSAGSSPPVALPVPLRKIRWPRGAARSGTQAPGADHGSPSQQGNRHQDPASLDPPGSGDTGIWGSPAVAALRRWRPERLPSR